MSVTVELFREDAYSAACDAAVVATAEDGAAVALDRTMFYPQGGGQPGDTGALRLADGRALAVADTRRDPASPGLVLHRLAEPLSEPLPAGTPVRAELDWPRRHRLMRVHSLLHLLCRAVGAPVTGGQVEDGRGRLDFDLPDAAPDKAALAAKLAGWIADDRPVGASWIDADELAARPELVRTMLVRPPVAGSGRVRLVEIEGVDLQACGGTHVRSTGEIGPVEVVRVEKKGRLNRRVVVALAG